jgi:hypothetical protein
MKNKKLNNLFVKGRCAAAVALLAALPFAQAKAYDERAYMTPGEQAEYQAYSTLPSDIENRNDTLKNELLALLCLLGPIILVGSIVSITESFENKKKNKQQQKQR